MVDSSPHGQLTQESLDLLEARTERFAAEKSSGATEEMSGGEESFVCFRMADQSIAVPLSTVREVVPVTTITSVPGAPPHLLGLMRLRGQVLALVNLRRFWQVDVVGHSDSDMAVIVEADGVDFGIICAEVEGLTTIRADERREVPPNTAPRLAESLLGLARREIMLVSPRHLVAQTGFVVDLQAE